MNKFYFPKYLDGKGRYSIVFPRGYYVYTPRGFALPSTPYDSLEECQAECDKLNSLAYIPIVC